MNEGPIPSSHDSERFQESVRAGYEVSHENTYGIIGVGILTLIISFGIFMLCWWLFDHFEYEVRKAGVSQPPFVRLQKEQWMGETTQIPPPPRLQINPQLDLEKMLKRDHRILTTFAWVDHLKGLKGKWVRIPIDDAMNLLVQSEKKKRIRSSEVKTK